MQLTKHFHLSEFITSETATRLGIDNDPTFKQCLNIMRMALFMEKVRLVLHNSPIVVTSGFRVFPLNVAIGGVSNSSHLNGLAADFYTKANLSLRECFDIIKESYLNFDQLILYDTFIHIGIGDKMRRQCLDFRKKK